MTKKIRKSNEIRKTSAKECNEDEIFTTFYKCNNCGSEDIQIQFKFCPECGLKINIPKDIKESNFKDLHYIVEIAPVEPNGILAEISIMVNRYSFLSCFHHHNQMTGVQEFWVRKNINEAITFYPSNDGKIIGDWKKNGMTIKSIFYNTFKEIDGSLETFSN